MTGRPWRFRRCPACGHVNAASKFLVAQTYAPGWRDGAMLRSCPACGHKAPTGQFKVVRERHPAVSS